jgi:RNA polymerase sigma factor (sigma-70 family)
MGLPTPPEPSGEATFLENLALIDRIIASIARRHSLVGDDADDFRSCVHTRLIEGDYAIIRKFGGRSAFSTFLAVVITNCFRDFRVQRWGRWRSSSVAKRLGDLAVRLEILLYRDGYSVQHATQVLRSAGKLELTDREVAELAAKLPPRQKRGAPDEATPETLPAEEQADDALKRSEQQKDQTSATDALERALAILSVEDQLILRLRYWEGFSIAEVARALRIDQKPLYRRIEADLDRLREELERGGLDGGFITGLFDPQ